MASLVVDTHAAIWYLLQSPKLSSAAYLTLDKSAELGDDIYISAISLIEVIYLAEKGRITQEAVDQLLDNLSKPETGWVLAPVDLNIAQTVAKIPRAVIPDMPDRIIAATALHLNLPLVTIDSKVRASGVSTIW